ncbi:E2F transcription factor-like [Trifolium repens]|nr:E2F transcription factor-like [Trifolium repens]
MISLDDAARLLLGDAYNSSTIRTKVRHLYDIANVLTSMNLIKKTHTTNTRKPAFRWLGLKGKTWNEASLYNQNKMSLGKGHLEMILQTLALCGTERICSWVGTSARTLTSERQWKMIVGCFRMTRRI